MVTKKPSFMENETMTQTNANQKNQSNQQQSHSLQKGQTTRIKVKIDVGFNNEIFLRGKGANLNWEKGVRLKCVKADEWIWETNQPFHECEFKVLINDKVYEGGTNHIAHQGDMIEFTPRF